MTDDQTQNLIDRLDDLVERERRALLSGDLPALPQILEQKEQLIDLLNATDLNPRPELEALKTKAIRNQAMLDGALQGIRNVAARMATIRKIRRSLETYDADGRKRVIDGAVDHQVEKRA